MKKFLFIFIFLSACDSGSKNSTTQPLKSEESPNLSQLNIKHQSRSPEKLKPELSANSALKSIEKSIWQVKSYLPVSFIDVSLRTEQNNSDWEIDTQHKTQHIDLGKGTGFFISPKLLITNFHVIQNMFNENINTVSETKLLESHNKPLALKLLKVSSIYDLALLESKTPVDYYLDIESTTQNLPTKSFLMAYTRNGFIKTPINYIKSVFDTMILFRRDMNLGDLDGASGAPVVSQTGELIGVNHAGSDTVSSIISSSAIKNFLDKNNRDCSDWTIEECIHEEWLFLEELSKKEDELALYMINTGLNYSQWQTKQLALKDLIKNVKQLTEVKEKTSKFIKKINRDNTKEEVSKVIDLMKEYELAIQDYNQSLETFNSI